MCRWGSGVGFVIAEERGGESGMRGVWPIRRVVLYWGLIVISASSSVASGLLSGYFGSTSGSASSSVLPGVGSASSSPDYVLAGSLGTSGSVASPFSFLSNAIFGEVTENLLRDPLANGAITGTASAQVQKIIGELSPTGGVGSSGSSQAQSTGGLPADGVLA